MDHPPEKSRFAAQHRVPHDKHDVLRITRGVHSSVARKGKKHAPLRSSCCFYVLREAFDPESLQIHGWIKIESHAPWFA